MNTDANEAELVRRAMQTPEERARLTEQVMAHEKKVFGSYPSGNRHERRKATKLARKR